jgi:hypothetical protein
MGWQTFYESIPDCDRMRGRAVGLVLPYGGIKGGLVIHNGQFHTRATRLRRRVFSFQTADRTFRIERLVHLAAAIKDCGWEPGQPWEPAATKISPSVLLRQVKGGPEKLVLLQLINILNGNIEAQPDWAAQLQLIVRVDGERWLCITHKEIGDALGLDVSQVRRALRGLRDQGMVESTPYGNCNLYRVNVEKDVNETMQ